MDCIKMYQSTLNYVKIIRSHSQAIQALSPALISCTYTRGNQALARLSAIYNNTTMQYNLETLLLILLQLNISFPFKKKTMANKNEFS